MPKIFISYKREDEAFARELREKLLTWGFAVWLDVIEIKAGENWDDSIHNGLGSSDIVIGVITPASLASRNVMDEWAFASTTKKPIFLLWLKDFDEAHMPPRYIRLQRIDFRQNHAQGYQKLAEDLKVIQSPETDDTKPPSPFQLPNRVDFLDLFGVKTVEELNIPERWRKSLIQRNADWPRVPIGIAANGKVRELYFTADGDGVHACIIGETGSGKSELLLNLLTSLAVNYDPTRVRFFLLGGWGFEEIRRFPHTAELIASIYNVSVEAHLQAIVDELVRRSHFLAWSNTKHIVDYQLRRNPANTPPFPHLFVVIDEFSELLHQHPNAMDIITSITRLGRAIGVHLILASQILPSINIEQVLVNTKMHIALNTDNVDDSQRLIGSDAATHIPKTIPGRAFLKIGNEALESLQIAYLSPYLASEWRFDEEDGQFINKAILEIAPAGLNMAHDWLDAFVVLEDLSPSSKAILSAIREGQELTISNSKGQAFNIALGLLEEVIEPYVLDLENNHLLILGDEATGKTTLLQSIALHTALHLSPAALNIHIFAPQDQKLHRIIAKLPQVKSLVDSQNTSAVSQALLNLEKRLNLQDWDDTSDLVLIDSLTSLLEANPDTLERWHNLIKRGHSMGVHFVITDTSPDRWENIYNILSERIALRLPQALDYVFALGTELRSSKIVGRGHIHYNGRPKLIQTIAPLADYAQSGSDGDASLAQIVLTLRLRLRS